MSTVKTTNITHGSNSGTANIILASDGNVSFAKTILGQYALLEDQKSSGTAGGTNTEDTWATRDLNTEVADPHGIVSISSNDFTLQAGSYLIKWTSSFYRVGEIKTRLLDVTNSAARGAGSSAYTNTSGNDQVESRGAARVTPSGATAYRIQYYNSDVKSSNGLGVEASSGEVEVYTRVEIYKEAS